MHRTAGPTVRPVRALAAGGVTLPMRPSRLLRTEPGPAGRHPAPPAPPTGRAGEDTTGRPMPLPRQPPPPAAGAPPAAAPSAAAPPAGAPSADPAQDAATAQTWALVQASQAGDMAAFEQLFERYYDVVFRFVLFRTNDRPLAEDLTSETFVRALRRISSVQYQGRDIAAWFITIARNLIFDHVKSSRYRLESTQADMVDLSPSTHGPEQQVLDGATYEELMRCVAKLNPDQQECIQLRFLQGLSVAETAQLMERNEGAVKALQHRAVRRLAQLLPEGIR